MSRRDLITNGMYSLLHRHDPAAPAAGRHVREGLHAKYDFWEIDQRVSNYYYEITKRDFAQETVPQKIFSGAGYLPFPAGTDLRRSKYSQI